MKNLIGTLIFLLAVFGMAMVSGSLDYQGVGIQDNNFTLTQVCSDATYINITTIQLPNREIISLNQNMLSLGSGSFAYNFSETNQVGRYDVCGVSDGCNSEFCFYFLINKRGKEIESSEAIIYIVLAIGVFILFALSFYFMIATPYSNKVNEKGAVIQITKLKYVKLGFILLTWVLLTWFLNILIGLSDNFVNLTLYYGFFGFIFDIMNRLALPLGIIIFVISIFEIIRDTNLYGNIKKFGSAYK